MMESYRPTLELRTQRGEPPDLRLLLPSRPESVSLVRYALGGLAEVLQLDGDLQIDINAAVSEACNNVVLHAYEPGEEGPLEVYICPQESELEVVVRDRGGGIRPRDPDTNSGEIQGVGLSLIQALSHRVAFEGGPGEGTEVRMGFDVERPIEFLIDEGGAAANGMIIPPPGETVISVVNGPLVAPVLGRVVSVLGARQGFSIEQLADASLLTDAIAAHAGEFTLGRHLHIGIDSADEALVLRVGPFEQDGGGRAVASSALAGLRPLLQQLSAGTEIEQIDGAEHLVLRLPDGD